MKKVLVAACTLVLLTGCASQLSGLLPGSKQETIKQQAAMRAYVKWYMQQHQGMMPPAQSGKLPVRVTSL